MKLVMILSIVLICFTPAAWCGEPCQTQRNEHDRALKRAAKVKADLENFENSPLAPLVPGQAEKELQKLKDSYEAALADVRRTSEDLEKCLKRKSCKKWKPGWRCTVAGTYEECCLDKNNTP